MAVLLDMPAHSAGPQVKTLPGCLSEWRLAEGVDGSHPHAAWFTGKVTEPGLEMVLVTPEGAVVARIRFPGQQTWVCDWPAGAPRS